MSLENDMQILLSTHSRHMLDEASNVARFLWMQNGSLYKEISEAENPDFIQLLLDLGALDKSDFLKNPNIKWVICTEDAKVDKEEMLKCVLESSGFDLNECIILPYSGCSKIENAILLHSFLQQSIPTAKMIIHRDRDYLKNEQIQEINEKLHSKDILLWVTPGTDIESLFVNTQHIHYLCSQFNEGEINTIVESAKNETKEKSIAKFVNYVSNNTNNRDYRDVNLTCEREYSSNPNRYFYGKRTLGVAKSKLQEALHTNPMLIKSSPFLDQQELRNLNTNG
jgi:hypothetical protein